MVVLIPIRVFHILHGDYGDKLNCPIVLAIRDHTGIDDVQEDVDHGYLDKTYFTHQWYGRREFNADLEKCSGRDPNDVIRILHLKLVRNV